MTELKRRGFFTKEEWILTAVVVPIGILTGFFFYSQFVEEEGVIMSAAFGVLSGAVTAAGLVVVFVVCYGLVKLIGEKISAVRRGSVDS